MLITCFDLRIPAMIIATNEFKLFSDLRPVVLESLPAIQA